MPTDQMARAIGLVYALAIIALVAFLLSKNRLTRNRRIAILILTTVLGFVIFAPMIPLMFQAIMLGNTASLGAPLPMLVAMLILFIALTLALGRIFCGYACPIGTTQELAYHIPMKKVRPIDKKIRMTIHIAMFATFVLLAVMLSKGLLVLIGINAFFQLNILSIPFIIFAVLLVLSTTLYRPFCRFICPYGLLLSLASMLSFKRLRRQTGCIECAKCEKTCPTNEAGRNDSKLDCYLCGRCVDVCPVDVIRYTKK